MVLFFTHFYFESDDNNIEEEEKINEMMFSPILEAKAIDEMTP